MNTDATSLDRLHDIVSPPPVSWWPPAPGWYVLIAIATCTLGWLVVRRWRQWHKNRYRRAALHELHSAASAVSVAEVLRRTALSVTGRPSIAKLTGDDWVEWLIRTSPDRMPSRVRSLLSEGVYRKAHDANDFKDLRDYAANWIRHHRLPETSST